MIIVAYDEFGGQWDHVSPPGMGSDGPHDVWGPGTRIASLVIAPNLKDPFVVDSREHDTTSILSTIEHRFGLAPLGTRDAAVNDLSTVFKAKATLDGRSDLAQLRSPSHAEGLRGVRGPVALASGT